MQSLEWADRFNNRRLLEPVGTIPPAEAETNSYAALENEAMAAQLTSISLRQTRSGSLAEISPRDKTCEKAILLILPAYHL